MACTLTLSESPAAGTSKHAQVHSESTHRNMHKISLNQPDLFVSS